MRAASAGYMALLERLAEPDVQLHDMAAAALRLSELLLSAGQAEDSDTVASAVHEVVQIFAEKRMELPLGQATALRKLTDNKSWLDPANLIAGLRSIDWPGNPTVGFVEFVQASQLLEGGHGFDGVRVLLALALRADRPCGLPARWRAELLLALALRSHKLLKRIFHDDSSLAVLFAKKAVRTLEAGRLETVAQGGGEITVLNDMGVDQAYTAARDLLVCHGRFGEALRVELLLEQAEARIPAPRIGGIAAAVEARCPFTTMEKAALDALEAIEAGSEARAALRKWFPRHRLPRWAAEMEAVEHRLREATRAAGTVGTGDLSAFDNGVGLLRVQSHGGDVFIGLGGRDSGRVIRLSGEEGALRDAVYAAMRALHKRSADAASRCRNLYNMILAPFEDALPKVLVVQSSGALRRIPFGVLFDGERYLIERCCVVTHPGTHVVDVSRGLRRPIRGVSVAVSETPGFECLPHATADARAVADAIGVKMTPLFDAAVTAAALDGIADLRPTLLHISCHFETDPSDAGRSGFVLGNGTRYELSRLAGVDLSSVDLALVIGCETRAVGDAPGTAGVLGPGQFADAAGGGVGGQHGLAGA